MLMVKEVAGLVDVLVLVLVVLLDAGLEVDVLLVEVGAELAEAPEHVTAAVPAAAARYQFAAGSPRQVPTVTEVPYPSAAIVLSMNSVRL